MSALLDNLNKEQKEAVLSINKPLVIIAGAGSGKTRTITHKIAHLIEEENVNPSRILGVTFTNKAALEMKERVLDLISEKNIPLFIQTYHSLCARILREDIELLDLPYNKKFNIIDNADQRLILAQIYKKYNLSPKTHSYNELIDFISRAKISGDSPSIKKANAKYDSEKVFANIYQDYCLELPKLNSLDFDDLLLLVKELLTHVEGMAKKWSSKFDFVLVDEFQDTSSVQYDIVKCLSSTHKNITIVGDPDQTIFTWRAADANLMNRFIDDYKAKVVKLEKNYRSTKTILDKANLLIKNNSHRIDKNLKPTKDEGAEVEFYHGLSDESEARWVVNRIQELKRSKTQLKDIAVIYRANYLSAPIEKALINQNIAYVIYGGIKFYQREEIKDCIAFLKVINNGDELSLQRIINVPARKIGQQAIENLIAYKDSLGLDLFTAITKHFAKAPLPPIAKKELEKFLLLVLKYRKALSTNPINLVLEKFLIEVGYRSLYSSQEMLSRSQNIDELIHLIKDAEDKNKNLKLNDYLNEIALYVDREETFSGNNFVSLMTAHSAKGLEFDNVFVIGFSDGVFPSKRSIEEGGKSALEEERRLAYVAITRAKEKLFITDSRGYSLDYKFQKKPSRFLTEMKINIKKFANEYVVPYGQKEDASQNLNFIEGDKILHLSFGEGVIVRVLGDLLEIAFRDPHGVKTLVKTHKSIERIS